MLIVVFTVFLFFCVTNEDFTTPGLSTRSKSLDFIADQRTILINKDADGEELIDDVIYFDDLNEFKRGKKDAKLWDHWGKWSACSVTCGVGKMTRWRHCVSDGCDPGEKEAQIKTCNMKPC